jgi:hypothetical protein
MVFDPRKMIIHAIRPLGQPSLITSTLNDFSLTRSPFSPTGLADGVTRQQPEEACLTRHPCLLLMNTPTCKSAKPVARPAPALSVCSLPESSRPAHRAALTSAGGRDSPSLPAEPIPSPLTTLSDSPSDNCPHSQPPARNSSALPSAPRCHHLHA